MSSNLFQRLVTLAKGTKQFFQPDTQGEPVRHDEAKRPVHDMEGTVSKVCGSVSVPSDEDKARLIGLFKKGDYSALESEARSLTERYPDSAFAWSMLGGSLHMQGKNALPVLAKTAELSPTDAAAHNNLGGGLKEVGRLDEALASFKRALEINPNLAEAHNNLGNIFLELKKPDCALESCRRAVEIKPIFADGHYNLGNAFRDLGRPNESIESYQKALEIQPNYVKALMNLGTAFGDSGRDKDALACYVKTTELDPNLAEGHFNLGTALWAFGDRDGAILAYQRSLALAPRSTAAVWLLILHYLAEDMESCQLMLQASQHFMSSAENKDLTARNYRGYLAQLVSYYGQHQIDYSNSIGLAKLYVIGESHCLATNGVEVCFRDQQMRCFATIIMGCKQWHLGNNKENQYKRTFQMALGRLPKKSTVLLTFGEIDCRADEGIIKTVNGSPGKTLDVTAYSTIAAYLSYVVNVNLEYQHNVIICGVPAPNVSLDLLPSKTASQLVCLIRLFNELLKKEANVAGMAFLDVYSLSDRGDGVASGNWHIDTYHLSPSAATEAFANHCID